SRVRPGEADGREPRRPDTHEPDGVETEAGDPLDLLRRNGVEGQPATGARRQLADPDTGVDLVEQWVPGPAVRHRERLIAEISRANLNGRRAGGRRCRRPRRVDYRR